MLKFLFTYDDENNDAEALVDYDNDLYISTRSEKIIGLYTGNTHYEAKKKCIDELCEDFEFDNDQDREEFVDKLERGLGWYQYFDDGINSTMHLG